MHILVHCPLHPTPIRTRPCNLTRGLALRLILTGVSLVKSAFWAIVYLSGPTRRDKARLEVGSNWQVLKMAGSYVLPAD